MRLGGRIGRLGALACAVLAWAGPSHATTAEAMAQTVERCGADAACLAKAEPLALRDEPDSVHRRGPSLTLQFGLHPAVRFDDQPNVTHTYLGRMDGVLLHVVRGLAPGGAARYWLVGESGQAPLAVDGVPSPAPGGRHFAVVAGPAMALFQRSGPRWSLQFRFEGPTGLEWRIKSWRADAAALRLDWHWRDAPAAACAGQAASGTLQLRDGPFGWDLVPEPPKRCAG